MSMSIETNRKPEVFPRLPLIGVGVAIMLTIAGAAAMELSGGPAAQPTARPVAERDLRFADRPDGSIAVTQAADGRIIDVLAPGSNGFVRATMRVLAQRRVRADEGPQVPFKLTAWSDGRMTLDDPQTGARVDLEAFGHSNVEAFARLLGPAAPGATTAPSP